MEGLSINSLSCAGMDRQTRLLVRPDLNCGVSASRVQTEAPTSPSGRESATYTPVPHAVAHRLEGASLTARDQHGRLQKGWVLWKPEMLG